MKTKSLRSNDITFFEACELFTIDNLVPTRVPKVLAIEPVRIAVVTDTYTRKAVCTIRGWMELSRGPANATMRFCVRQSFYKINFNLKVPFFIHRLALISTDHNIFVRLDEIASTDLVFEVNFRISNSDSDEQRFHYLHTMKIKQLIP
ncbi:hypothetical protein BpHYR1_040876 [Brachionus plicatilis]|uniref:Uncharacterized protein n=1 Tax=Brachionus plicatilis TaxID=10195 RepID=A0A3M7T8A3_BRAPC|nr:hypothetical protein BpHYR1_040876 [Brachionus plicatilis]